ncbi:MAG: adenylate/guanylate cyclase domain-containing protein [Flavobacteriales bacterium]
MRAKLFVLVLACVPFTSLAQANVDSLLKVLGMAAPDTNRVSLLNAVAAGYSQSAPDSTIAYGSRAAELAERLNFKPGLAEAFKNIGYGHLKREEYGIAIPLYHRSLDLWTALGNADQQQRIHYNLAWMAQQQSDFPGSLEHYLASLRFAEQKGDSAEAANVRMSIGNVYDQMGEHEQAISILRRVLHMYEQMGDSLSIAQASSNLGTVLDNDGQYEEGLTHLLRSLQIARTLKEPMGEAITMGSIANHYQRLEQWEEALKYNEEVLGLFEQLGDPYSIAAASINTGEILTRLERYDEAKQHINKGIEMARIVGVKQWLSNAHAGLYDVANAQGDAAEALKQFKLHIAYQDSITNEANTRKAVQVQMQYDFDKKEAATKAEQEKKDQRARLVRNGIAGGLAFSLLFLGVVWSQRNRISKEKARSEELLLNILPEEVAEELKAKGEADAKQIDQVTVLFTDFKGFTAMSEKLTAKELVADIHECFSAFDRIMEKHGIEKIKTIGDAYMAAGGLPTPNSTHALDVVKAAFGIRDFIAAGKADKMAKGLPYFEIRIGVHTGPVVAGIVGVKKFAYDIWGDTVNTASRMESSGEVGEVNISESTYALVKDEPGLTFTSRGKVVAKGKGELEMYFVHQSSDAAREDFVLAD